MQRQLRRGRAAAALALRGRAGLVERCREQFAYGHRETLLDYMDLDHNLALRGHLPHEQWGDGATVSEVGPFRAPTGQELPRWVPNDLIAGAYRRGGAKRVIPIGSVWLYHLANRGIRLDPASPPPRDSSSVTGRTLLVPVHSWELAPARLRERVRHWAVHLDASATTVLLYWADFLDRELRQAITREGFDVTCAGYRGGQAHPWSAVGDRTHFLGNLTDVFLSHDLIVSDHVGTAVVYAASLGKPTMLMNQGHSERALQDVVPTETAKGISSATERYGWLADSEMDDARKWSQLCSLLGAQHLLCPSDLKESCDFFKIG